ncbi:hypothetical protein [Thalassotalea fusca]
MQRKLVAFELSLILAAVIIVILKYNQALPYSYILALIATIPTHFLIAKFLPPQHYCQNFELDRFGLMHTADNQLYQLSACSRVGWFGCLLVFEVTAKYSSSSSMFIYNDSVCPQTLSRLKRTIYYLQKHGRASEAT